MFIGGVDRLLHLSHFVNNTKNELVIRPLEHVIKNYINNTSKKQWHYSCGGIQCNDISFKILSL